MKVCQYCGSVNEDTVTVCSACGASEFTHKCNNCGTAYEDAERCPNCGVRADAKPKKCPTCGTEYYTGNCPKCESVRREYKSTHVHATPSAPIKERKTWLWVLGWLLCFPIPAFVLMWRTESIFMRIVAVCAIPFLVYAYIDYSLIMIGLIAITLGY